MPRSGEFMYSSSIIFLGPLATPTIHTVSLLVHVEFFVIILYIDCIGSFLKNLISKQKVRKLFSQINVGVYGRSECDNVP